MLRKSAIGDGRSDNTAGEDQEDHTHELKPRTLPPAEDEPGRPHPQNTKNQKGFRHRNRGLSTKQHAGSKGKEKDQTGTLHTEFSRNELCCIQLSKACAFTEFRVKPVFFSGEFDTLFHPGSRS